MAKRDTISVEILFRLGDSRIDKKYLNNKSRIEAFKDRLETMREDSAYRIVSVRIVGHTSPEGGAYKKRLARRRAEALRDYFRDDFPGARLEILTDGVDWETCEEAIKEEPDIPFKDEVMDVLQNTPTFLIRNGKVQKSRRERLMALRGGIPYRHIMENVFPWMRRGRISVIFERFDNKQNNSISFDITPASNALPKPFYLGLKSNTPSDVLLIPSIGAEYYIKYGVSVGGNLYGSWWSFGNNKKWHTWCVELYSRRYFGAPAADKPLTGHHLGVYCQMLGYNLKVRNKGYTSKFSGGIGLEYGYSLPIARRFNIDFSLGLGYLGGKYDTYHIINNRRVVEQTKRTSWFGPTRAEVSLIWLIGRTNHNTREGQAR